jgi:hypothetical protein
MSEHGAGNDVAGNPLQPTLNEQIILLFMSTVEDIETAVRSLSAEELDAFRNRLREFDAAAWDRQIEADVYAGRLDALAAEALADLDAKRCLDR